jgi:succinoglycan biosynthesis transport protein ExoP
MSDLTLRAPRAVEPVAMPQASEVLRGVRRHVWLVGGITTVVALAVGGITLTLPTRYTAEARIYVSPQTPDPLVPSETAHTLADDELTTIAQLLQSRDLAMQVVAQLPPPVVKPGQAPPRLDQRVNQFLSGLTATPEDRSRVIDLKYVDADPVHAAAALNTLISEYQHEQVSQTGEDLRRTSVWLSKRADDLRNRWLQAAARVGAFASAHGLTSSGSGPDGQTLVSQQIGHAAADLATAQSELAAAQAKQAALRGAPDAGSAGQIADSPAVVAMSTQLSELEGRAASLHSEYGPEHPSVQSIDHQVAMARASLGAATGRARRAVDTEVRAEQAAVATLTANLARLKSEAGGQSGSEVDLMTLTNEATDARTAYEAFLSRAKQLDDRTQLVQPQVHFASHAAVPDSPSFPNKPRFLLAGLALGLMGGIGAAMTREHMRRGFANISRVSDALSLPLLSAVPLVAAGPRELPFFLDENPYSAAAESVRTLAAALQFGRRGAEPPRSLVIASATGAEGKTTIAIWLATALAAAGQRVLLIDGDHRRGAISERLGGGAGPGFTELIAGAARHPAVIRHAAIGGFDYIGAGGATARVLGQNELGRLRAALERFRDDYDLVIIDTPPLLAMTEALLFARAADATVFVCRWNSTARQAVSASLDRLEQAGAQLMGVVLSMVDHTRLALFSDEHRGRDVKLIEGYYRHH